MFEKQSHADEYVSSGTSPTKPSATLSAEDLHEFALAMQRIFDEPPAPAVTRNVAHHVRKASCQPPLVIATVSPSATLRTSSKTRTRRWLISLLQQSRSIKSFATKPSSQQSRGGAGTFFGFLQRRLFAIRTAATVMNDKLIDAAFQEKFSALGTTLEKQPVNTSQEQTVTQARKENKTRKKKKSK